MVGDGQFEPEQAQDAAAKRLRLPQGKVEHQPQDEHQLDRQIGVQRLSTRRAPAWSLPPGERRLVEPERQIVTPA